MKYTYQSIGKLIRTYKKVLIVSHYNPDPDAIGSSVGLTLSLRASGYTADCINESNIPEKLKFIPGIDVIQSSISDLEYDALIALDCGAYKRIGDVLGPKLLPLNPKINIDHHYSNELFGVANLIDPKTSSTSEIVYNIIKASGLKFTPSVSTCLLSGIYGDTGSMRYESAGKNTFQTVADLIELGADKTLVIDGLYSRNSISQVKLQARAFSNLELIEDGKVGIVTVLKSDYLDTDSSIEDADGFVEMARDINGVQVSASIREDEDLFRVSLRSKSKDISKVAESFGGGGHKFAAAFRWRKGIDELKEKLKKALIDIVK